MIRDSYEWLRSDRQNLEERKKAKAGYQAYDDEAELEAAALGAPKAVLAKYDDEIDKHHSDKSRGFVIGDPDAADAQRFRDLMVSSACGQTAIRRTATEVDLCCSGKSGCRAAPTSGWRACACRTCRWRRSTSTSTRSTLSSRSPRERSVALHRY